MGLDAFLCPIVGDCIVCDTLAGPSDRSDGQRLCCQDVLQKGLARVGRQLALSSLLNLPFRAFFLYEPLKPLLPLRPGPSVLWHWLARTR